MGQNQVGKPWNCPIEEPYGTNPSRETLKLSHRRLFLNNYNNGKIS